MATSSHPEDRITNQLHELRRHLDKKRTFESAIASIKSLLLENYSTSSLPTQTLFYDVVCRVAAVLRSRYTAPGFLLAGADLLDAAEGLTVDPGQKTHLRSCISNIRSNVNLEGDGHGRGGGGGHGRGGYLFEGHLTTDPEPPQPNWLIQQNLMTALTSQARAGNNDVTDGTDDVTDQTMGGLLRGLVESLEGSMVEGLEEFLNTTGPRTAPPASKEAVSKLPVIKVDEAILAKVGDDAECCICKEKLRVGDEMHELPCKHLFHPPCLKPWLDEHNSCPICRHELPTDDHKYESWKEKEKELEEERRGAANALPGGEFMYV